MLESIRVCGSPFWDNVIFGTCMAHHPDGGRVSPIFQGKPTFHGTIDRQPPIASPFLLLLLMSSRWFCKSFQYNILLIIFLESSPDSTLNLACTFRYWRIRGLLALSGYWRHKCALPRGAQQGKKLIENKILYDSAYFGPRAGSQLRPDRSRLRDDFPPCVPACSSATQSGILRYPVITRERKQTVFTPVTNSADRAFDE